MAQETPPPPPNPLYVGEEGAQGHGQYLYTFGIGLDTHCLSRSHLFNRSHYARLCTVIDGKHNLGAACDKLSVHCKSQVKGEPVFSPLVQLTFVHGIFVTQLVHNSW